MQKIDDRRKLFNKIISLVIKNPQKGLELFYGEYRRLIYQTAKNVGCKDEQAEAVVNKVLVKIWRKAESLSDIQNPDGYVYVVARNSAKDEVNEIWHLELNEKIIRAEDEFETLLAKDSFEYLVSCLNEEEQAIMTLKFAMKDKFQEIANQLEKPLPTITSLYYRGLSKIKKFIKEKKSE